MRRRDDIRARIALDSPSRVDGFARHGSHRGPRLNASAERQDASRAPLRDHVANSVRRYLHDLDGCDTDDLYNIALRELEIPLFAEVLRHCDGNQSRAATMLGIHRATLRKKLKDYGLSS
jgi:Fis family transcriptional regulator